MSFIAEIGEIHEKGSIEWKIHDFFSLSDNVDDCYHSPVFNFSDSSWVLRLCPNGETRNLTSNYVSLHLLKKDSGPPLTVHFTLGIKCTNGLEMASEIEWKFSKKDDKYGWIRFRARSMIREQKSRFAPNDVMTIICNLKNYAHRDTKASFDYRHGNFIRDLKSILTGGKGADFTIKLGTCEWPVHKIILESRSEYFANMFRHEWVENAVGEVKFDDIEEDALRNVLHFIYTCEVECMSPENVCEIYVAAHKFLLEDLKTLCIEYMKKSMCMEIICRVLIISKTYEEEDLNELALEYFFQEADKILCSEEWKQLKKNNLPLVEELMEDITLRERKKQIQE